jgi:hypothetical protein
MQRSVEVSNSKLHPLSAEADAQILADAPAWWREKVVAIRSAKTDAEVRAICSRSSDPNPGRPEKRNHVVTRTSFSKAADLAWDQFVKDPKRFAEKHGVRPEADDSIERRRQALNSLL